jgi:hypothetical protein
MPKHGEDGTRIEDVIRLFLGAQKAKPGAQFDFSIGITTIQSKYSKYYRVRPTETKARGWIQPHLWAWDDLFGDSGTNVYDWLLLSGLRPGCKLSYCIDDLRLFAIPFDAVREVVGNGHSIVSQSELTATCKKKTRLVLKHERDKDGLRSWAEGLKTGTEPLAFQSITTAQGLLFK